MRYSLLDHLGCPACYTPLVSVTASEVASQMPAGLFPVGTRVASGPGVGPSPSALPVTPLTSLLKSLAGPAATPERGNEVDIVSGLLVCGGCGRWYPIEGGIPELLPDHLRDAARERTLFDAALADQPSSLRDALAAFTPSGDASTDPGAHYKQAEIGIKSKIDDPVFFGPGYSSPFNPWNTDFTVYLIALFGAVAPMLGISRGQTLVDSGCGYAWSTEWFFRSGINVIGVDICRTYLEIGIARIGAFRPHLVVGDVENLPLASGQADGILAYESFHHIPDRQRALASYDRVLKKGGTVILAEPGGEHEDAKVSVDAMEKFGILEKGMELDDVEGYAEGTTFGAPEQLHLLRVTHVERGLVIDDAFVKNHSAYHSNFFKLVKGAAKEARRTPPAVTGMTRLVDRVKRRVRRRLNRMA
jgi:uncharacterized protein YbaR (Trm112 family)/SAM-dependent methyltransferase